VPADSASDLGASAWLGPAGRHNIHDEAGGNAKDPSTFKESFNVAGLETTHGVPEWKGYDR